MEKNIFEKVIKKITKKFIKRMNKMMPWLKEYKPDSVEIRNEYMIAEYIVNGYYYRIQGNVEGMEIYSFVIKDKAKLGSIEIRLSEDIIGSKEKVFAVIDKAKEVAMELKGEEDEQIVE
jgi:hypothetical protein